MGERNFVSLMLSGSKLIVMYADMYREGGSTVCVVTFVREGQGHTAHIY